MNQNLLWMVDMREHARDRLKSGGLMKRKYTGLPVY